MDEIERSYQLVTGNNKFVPKFAYSPTIEIIRNENCEFATNEILLEIFPFNGPKLNRRFPLWQNGALAFMSKKPPQHCDEQAA